MRQALISLVYSPTDLHTVFNSALSISGFVDEYCFGVASGIAARKNEPRHVAEIAVQHRQETSAAGCEDDESAISGEEQKKTKRMSGRR